MFEDRAYASPDELGYYVPRLAVFRSCRRLFAELKMYDAVVSVDAIQHISSFSLVKATTLTNHYSGWTVMLKSFNCAMERQPFSSGFLERANACLLPYSSQMSISAMIVIHEHQVDLVVFFLD
jgi:hypothetical protein